MLNNNQTNLEKINLEIYTNAVKLAEVEKYKEKLPTLPYHLCDSLLVNHDKKKFWFTDTETANHTLKVN